MPEFQDVFVSPVDKVGFTNWVKQIDIKIAIEIDTGHVKLQHWQKSFFEKKHVAVEVEKLTKEDQIKSSIIIWEHLSSWAKIRTVLSASSSIIGYLMLLMKIH